MTHSGKIMITLSQRTLRKLNRLERQSGILKKRHINRAICAYLKREEKKDTISSMRQGYEAMGKINLELANDLPGIDQNDTISF